MNLRMTAFFVLRAFLFATVIVALWLLIRRKKIKFHKAGYTGKILWLKIAFVFYVAALIQITVLRDFDFLTDFHTLTRSMDTIELRLFYTANAEGTVSLWRQMYHVLGNVGWFIPFGFAAPFIYKRLRPLPYLVFSSFVLSLTIEALQWLLATGSSDIDDLFFNVMGAFIGWVIYMTTCGIRSLVRSRGSSD